MDGQNVSLERGKENQFLYTNAASVFSQMLSSLWDHPLPHEEGN